VELRHEGVCGYGEASLPPYRHETVESVTTFLGRISLGESFGPGDLPPVLAGLYQESGENTAACAAMDMALHDWFGKRHRFSWMQRWGLSGENIRPTSFTLGIASPDEIRAQVKDASDFESLKIKLGSDMDKEIIDAVSEATDQKIRVDVNQGWKDRSEALRMIEWLAVRGVELVEQPLPKDRKDDLFWLKERSPLPIIADEGVERSADLAEATHLYHGANVKLMKCGGMAEAYGMLIKAKELGLRTMLGCMTETSCAISAAAQMASLANWVDLDGALLIGNDPFDGAYISGGRVKVPDRFGNGVEPNEPLGKELAWISL
jgi:L-alanine-DL-glutamate epimerase-like enolase superfamily enzyme